MRRRRRNPDPAGLAGALIMGGLVFLASRYWPHVEALLKPAPPPSGTRPPASSGGSGSGTGGGAAGSPGGSPRPALPPSSGGGTGGGQQPQQPPAAVGSGCRTFGPGNTVLEFSVEHQPSRQVGDEVVFWCRLSGWVQYPDEENPVWRGIPWAVVEIWDADRCRGFGSMQLNERGEAWAKRPLQPDELNGYRCYAVFFGHEAYDAASTGVWNVVPQ